MSSFDRYCALLAASLMAGAVYLQSTPLLVVATLAGMSCVMRWLQWSAPHDHWRGLRRKRPWDPYARSKREAITERPFEARQVRVPFWPPFDG